ncbi:MAG: glucokinase [Thermodesulfobacteriota bacterium]
MITDHKKHVVLAGDVGGTKTIFGIFAYGEEGLELLEDETIPSREARSLGDLVARFIENRPYSISSACFGIPGPVSRGRCRTTNLPWSVSESELKSRFGWSHVQLLNDLAAMAKGIPALGKRRFAALNRPRIRPGLHRALLAPGTGLGMSLILSREDNMEVLSSEGGHADFAPSDNEEIDLWRRLRERFGHVSLERILSGPGLVNIYEWLRDSGRHAEPSRLAHQIEDRDLPAAITRAALEQHDPLCLETLRRFTSILGAAAGNVALMGLTTGGVYLGGGIPPRILPILKEGHFFAAFRDKGRFRPLMEKIAVRVILDQRTALLGAARSALERP